MSTRRRCFSRVCHAVCRNICVYLSSVTKLNRRDKKMNVNLMRQLWLSHVMKYMGLAIIPLLSAILLGCDCRDGIYRVIEYHEHGLGRYLALPYEDSLMVDSLSNPSNCYNFTHNNLYCREKEQLQRRPDDSTDCTGKKYLLTFIHRASGRVDTLYRYTKPGGDLLLFGYISGYKRHERWMVLEHKDPEEILGCNYLCRPIPDKRVVHLDDCTYEGQKKFFDSCVADYWIVNLYSTDFYGPFNMNELKVQMHKLGIPLPMRLYGIYDRYVCNFSDEPEPKAFYWPHHHRREGTLIE